MLGQRRKKQQKPKGVKDKSLKSATLEAMTPADFKFITTEENLSKFWAADTKSGLIDNRSIYSIQEMHNVQAYYEFGNMSLVLKNEKREVEGYLMGFISPSDPSFGVIHAAAVLKSKRKKGVASTLYEEFERRCARQNAIRLRVITRRTNKNMIEFHKKIGFFTDSSDENQVTRGIQDAVALIREII